MIARHLESKWNAAKADEKGESLRDAGLSKKGEAAGKAFAERIGKLGITEVVCSPLTRAIETAKATGLQKITINPLLREVRRDWSDVGSPAALLKEKYGISVEENWWLGNGNCTKCVLLRECDACVSARAAQMGKLIAQSPKNILYVSHCDFIEAMFGVQTANGEILPIGPC
jgi:broad specificity phosphatase PhoE